MSLIRSLSIAHDYFTPQNSDISILLNNNCITLRFLLQEMYSRFRGIGFILDVLSIYKYSF